jgi:hypothetical protein
LELTLVLKADGEKLTGTIGAFDQTIDIMDGSLKKDELEFKVLDPNGIKSHYTGKVDGDTIKGDLKAEIPSCDPLKLEWKATRQKK